MSNKMIVAEHAFFLEIKYKGISQVIELNQLPATIGRSRECQVVINDQTIAPVQFVVDKDEDGCIYLEDYSGCADNPTIINRTKIKDSFEITDTPVNIRAGRVKMRLCHSNDTLAETVQLKSADIIGLLSNPAVAVMLCLFLFATGVNESILNSIETFSHPYESYMLWIIFYFIAFLHIINMNNLRLGFSLITLSLSLLSITILGSLYWLKAIDAFEYAVNININNLLAFMVIIVLMVLLWFAALKKKLHLRSRSAFVQAVLISFPLFLAMLLALSRNIELNRRIVKADINGKVAANHFHFSETKDIDSFFSHAYQRLNADESRISSVPFNEPPDIIKQKKVNFTPKIDKNEKPSKKVQLNERTSQAALPVNSSPADANNKTQSEPKKTYTYVYSESDLIENDHAQVKSQRQKRSRSRLSQLGKRVASTPRLAIIIDDVATIAHVRDLNALNLNMTYSFLPPSKSHPNSALIAKHSKNVMVHLPMEAVNYGGEELGTLHVGDSEDIIDSAVANAVKHYPQALFINNHTGSLFTSDETSMNALFKSMKKHDIAFLDSLTTQQSVAKKYATRYSVPFLARDVFLDDKDSYKSIARQLQLAISIAKRKGQAIAIGHPRRNTINVLNTHRHLLRQVNLVSVTELELE